MKRMILLFFSFIIGLTACGPAESVEETEPEATAVPAEPTRAGTGPNSSMRDRHHAPIPEEYADLINPVASDEESLARGGVIYVERCATCHGDGGMGDGPTSVALDPAPVAIAHTSQMMGDSYLFYRISEGGLFPPFNSTMPAWKEILDEQARWDVINYVRALGSGEAAPQGPNRGAAYDPAEEAAKHAAMVTEGVAQELFTQTEGDTFLAVHALLDVLLVADDGTARDNMDSRQTIFLQQLVGEGQISQTDADTFTAVHDTLMAAGLME